MCSGGELQEELKRAAAQSLGASIEESMKPADLEWAQRGSATMVEALRAAKERLATRKAQVGEAAALAELDASIRGQSPPPPPPLLTRRPKLWLLDRDGCINEDVGAPGVLRADELSLIPGSAGAVRRLRLAGRVAIVTNQSARGKGLLSAAELDAIHEALRHQLATTARGGRVGREQWDALYVCEDAGPSGRKKPSAGMVVQALDDFGCAPSEAVMIGDSWSDVVAARRAGCVGVLLATGHGAALGEALVREQGAALPVTIRSAEEAGVAAWLRESCSAEDGEQGGALGGLVREALQAEGGVRVYRDLSQAVDELVAIASEL